MAQNSHWPLVARKAGYVNSQLNYQSIIAQIRGRVSERLITRARLRLATLETKGGALHRLLRYRAQRRLQYSTNGPAPRRRGTGSLVHVFFCITSIYISKMDFFSNNYKFHTENVCTNFKNDNTIQKMFVTK